MRTLRRSILTRLAVGLLVGLVAACGGPATDPGGPPRAGLPTTLAGTSWGVLSVGGRASVPGKPPMFTFAGDTVKGTAGCNQFGGQYRYAADSGTLTLDQIAATEMGCLGPEGAFEGVFLQAFAGRLTVTREENGLVLTGPNGAIHLAPAARDTNAG